MFEEIKDVRIDYIESKNNPFSGMTTEELRKIANSE